MKTSCQELGECSITSLVTQISVVFYTMLSGPSSYELDGFLFCDVIPGHPRSSGIPVQEIEITGTG